MIGPLQSEKLKCQNPNVKILIPDPYQLIRPHHGNGDFVEDLVDDQFGGDFSEAAFGFDDEAVLQDRGGDSFDVVGEDELASPDRGNGLGCAEQRDRRAGASSESNIIVFAGFVDDRDDVVANFRVDVHLGDFVLALDDVFCADDRLERVDGVFFAEQFEHPEFFVFRGVTQTQADQKPVELGFGEREGSFVIDGVLRGDDQKRLVEFVGGSVNGHAMFGHRFEESGLSSGGGPVDFVRQKDLGEDRTRAEFELGVFGIEDRGSGNIAGQQVGRALGAFEGSSDTLGERAGEHCFGDSGNVFEEDVSLREIGDEDLDQFLPFAEDDVFDVGDEPFGDLVDLCHSRCAFLKLKCEGASV